MKQFLRYQISGTTFIIWVIIFYYGSISENTITMLEKFFENKLTVPLSGVITALPIGVLIHQFSVLLKNLVFSILFDIEHLSDDPSTFNFSGLSSSEKDYTEYILERISNLNSFYYVRVDNALLAPTLALVFCCLALDVELYSIKNELSLMLTISGLTLAYLPMIFYEMKCYQKMLALNTANSKPTTNH